MKITKKLLVVANLLNKSHLEKIKHFCKDKLHNDIEVHLAYIVPVIPTYYMQIPSSQSLQDVEIESAKLRLETCGNILNVSETNKWLLHGSINWAAHALAEKLDIENIILEDDMEDVEQVLHDLLIWNDIQPSSPELLSSNSAKTSKGFFYDFSYV